MYSIFATLNNSIITNAAITTALIAIVFYIIANFVIYAIADICQQRKAHQQMLNDIAHGRFTNKYQLQNYLIMELA